MADIKKKNSNKKSGNKKKKKVLKTNSNVNSKKVKTSTKTKMKNTSTNKKTNQNQKNDTLKKSNYKKIQGKVLEEKKKKVEIEQNKKQTKQNKQVARNIKKEKEKNEQKLKRKIYLVIVSCLIKIKNFFIRIYLIIKSFSSFLINKVKNIFSFIIGKIKLIGKDKSNKKEKNKVIKKKKVLEDDVVPRKNIKLKKNHETVTINSKKPLRSLTGRVLPSSFLKADRKIRKTFYLKEALIFMIAFTLIDFIGFYRIKKIDMFHIFDNSIGNIVLTTTFTMLIIFIGTYIIDYMVTEITLRIRKRKR